MRFRHVKLIGSPGSYQLSDSNRDLILDINDAAAMIWQLCGNENTVEYIIRNIVETYGQPYELITKDIASVLNQFCEQHVIRMYKDCYIEGTELDFGVTYHEIPSDLHDCLESYRLLVQGFFPGNDEGIVSPLDYEALISAMNNDVANAEVGGNALSLKFVKVDGVNNLIRKIIQKLDTNFAPLGVTKINTGRMLYGGNSFMGWHTNEDFPGRRIYCNWSENEGENDFRYLDTDSGEIIVQPEPAGWSMKSFYIPPLPQQLWHCINISGRRIALGFGEARYKKFKD